MSKKNNFTKEDKKMFAQYKAETGKRASIAGKVTNAFKEWKQALEVLEICVEEQQEIEEVINEVKQTESIKKRPRPKTEDYKQEIYNHLESNSDKWFCHADFVEVVNISTKRIRPILVELLAEDKVERKTEKRKNYYKFISD